MVVRNRAVVYTVMRLKKSSKTNDPCSTLPTLDDAITAIIQSHVSPKNLPLVCREPMTMKRVKKVTMKKVTMKRVLVKMRARKRPY